MNIKCRGCEKTSDELENDYVEMQYDNYDIPTGYWCNKCYNSSKYPYRKDNYFDPGYAGERMEDDY